MPFVPETKRVFVNPTNYVNRIATEVVDDGSWYQVYFESGYYDQSFTITLTNGGVLLRSYPGHLAWFRGVPGATPVWTFVAPDVRMHGINLEGTHYAYSAPVAEYDSGVIIHPTVRLGNIDAMNSGIDTTYIELADVHTLGRCNVGIHPSTDSIFTADVLVQQCSSNEAHANDSWAITTNTPSAGSFSPGTGIRANIVWKAFTSNSINGPDGPGVGVDMESSHRLGTAGWSIERLGKGTRVRCENHKLNARVAGSLNAGLHCFRLNQLNDPDIEVLLQDVYCTGSIDEGVGFVGDGGTDTWLGFSASTDGDGACDHTLPTLPLVEFDNCTFVHDFPTTWLGTKPDSERFGANSPAEFKFYDCQFSFDNPAAQWSTHYDVRIKEDAHGNIVVTFHSRYPTSGTSEPLVEASGVPNAQGHVWYADDGLSFQYGPSAWRRLNPEAYDNIFPLVQNADFEISKKGGGWTLAGGGATIGNGLLNMVAQKGSFFTTEATCYQIRPVSLKQQGTFVIKGDIWCQRQDDLNEPLRISYWDQSVLGWHADDTRWGLDKMDTMRWYYNIPLGFVRIDYNWGWFGIRFDLDTPGSVGQVNWFILDNIRLTRV